MCVILNVPFNSQSWKLEETSVEISSAHCGRAGPKDETSFNELWSKEDEPVTAVLSAMLGNAAPRAAANMNLDGVLATCPRDVPFPFL